MHAWSIVPRRNVGTAMPQVLDEVSSIVLGGKMYIVGKPIPAELSK